MQLAVLRAEVALQPRPSSRSHDARLAAQDTMQQGAHAAPQPAAGADGLRPPSAAPESPPPEPQGWMPDAADPATAPAAGFSTGGSGGLKVAKLQVGYRPGAVLSKSANSAAAAILARERHSEPYSRLQQTCLLGVNMV
jgi:hypothetical protein